MHKLFHRQHTYLVRNLLLQNWRWMNNTRLCGITLLVPPLCLTDCGNLCQCHDKALGNVQKTSREPMKNFLWSTITYVQPQPAFFLGSAPKAVWHICVDHYLAVSRRCMQITISNQNGNHANEYPVCCWEQQCYPSPYHKVNEFTLSVQDQGGATQITKFMGPTWGPSGTCRPQMGPMLAPWTLLSGYIHIYMQQIRR